MDHYTVLKDLRDTQESEFQDFSNKYPDSVPRSKIVFDWIDSGRADHYVGLYKNLFSKCKTHCMSLSSGDADLNQVNASHFNLLRNDFLSLDDFFDEPESEIPHEEDLSKYLPHKIHDY